MIRDARLDDIAALRQIERAAGRLFAEIGMAEVADDDPPSDETLRGYQGCGRAWVAVDDFDRPIGYLIADVLDGNAHIEQLSVLPANMRKGLGRALIEHLAAWASGRGLPALTLTTFDDVPGIGRITEGLASKGSPKRRSGQSFETDATTRLVAVSTGWPRICMRRALPPFL